MPFMSLPLGRVYPLRPRRFDKAGVSLVFQTPSTSSVQKGESLEDTIRMLSGYADAIVLRHPESGSAARARDVSHVPIINAGDGSNEHPTQTLLDLFTVWETQGTLENLSIALVGDLKHGRTVHSLVKALVKFGPQTFYAVAPTGFSLPQELIELIEANGSTWIPVQTLAEVVPKVHVLYMTRLQKERLLGDLSGVDYASCQLKLSDLAAAKPYFKILHPLPRLSEIPVEIDQTAFAYYFEQAENGVYVRQALLHYVIGDFDPEEAEDENDDLSLDDDDQEGDLAHN
jgi:aspartate carbamoyltransferase catalytic subunit